jgi:anion-transporting  ArsA/GET3 family ATPase
MTRITLVVGAGGVGKTTVAAGIAALAARRGARTLAITVDPARRLADALGTTLDNHPSPVPGHDRLDAAMLDAAAAWEQIARTHADPATARRLLANPYFRAVADRFPSGQAYAAGEQVLTHFDAALYDRIVVDTPPAAGGTAFLDAPRRIRTLVAGRALRVLTGPRLPGRRLIYSVTARPALMVADSVLGGRLLEDVAEFLLDLSAIYPGISRRSRRVEAMLQHADVVVVTTPDPGPIAEARRVTTERLVPRGVPPEIVFNRMLPAGWAGTFPTPAAEPIAQNLARWGLEASHHQAVLNAFAAHTGLNPRSVPWLAAAPDSPAALADLIAAAGIDPVS